MLSAAVGQGDLSVEQLGFVAEIGDGDGDAGSTASEVSAYWVAIALASSTEACCVWIALRNVAKSEAVNRALVMRFLTGGGKTGMEFS
jgi:hypothetical protein